MSISRPGERSVIIELESALQHTAYLPDLKNTSNIKRFPSGATVRPFRLDPKKSFEHLTEKNAVLAALKAHQEGNREPLMEISLGLAVHGISLEIRTYPGTTLITGVALVSKDAKIVREILSSLR